MLFYLQYPKKSIVSIGINFCFVLFFIFGLCTVIVFFHTCPLNADIFWEGKFNKKKKVGNKNKKKNGK